MWLGRFREHERAWHEAIVAYLSVSPRAAEFEAAAEAAGRCSYQWMEELKAAGQPLDSQADRVAAYFEDVIMGADRRLPAQWNSVARYAAVTAARLRLQYQSTAHAHVTSMLQAAIDGSPDAPETWKATARSLQVVALAGQTAYRDKAQETLRQIAGGEPAEMLKMLVNLAALGRSAPSRANADLASLQLEAVELLWPKKEQLPRSSQLTLECIRARALADVGKRAEAHELFEILARDNPNDGQIQESYAEFLLDGRDQSTLKKALDQWRLVASKSRPRSDAWYQAKYSLALAEFKLGNKQRSAQLIRYLQFTPPGLEATERKSQFLALLKLCEQ
jgi:tetratricopeptide (TPR) repeat protein